jgi:SAM-dependent methyltransferase
MDFIYSHAVFIHNDSQQLCLIFEELKRLLKPSGTMLHDFLNKDHPDSRVQIEEAKAVNFPLYSYDEEEIALLSQQWGFNCIRLGELANRNYYIFIHKPTEKMEDTKKTGYGRLLKKTPITELPFSDIPSPDIPSTEIKSYYERKLS